MPRVSFLHPQGRSGEVESNLTLLEAAKTLGFELNHDCGGTASCTTCRFELQMGGTICRRLISTNRTCWTVKPCRSLGIG